ncbi:MAG TPA: glycosyltransferase family A protein [Rhodothermales bacterium]|nr:glycosyltransferase family A protein [Rhodothermales bacterium]
MAFRPLVSIITPTFNHAEFIGPCIESVLSQTYANWELLIVNDGSDDATGSIAERYAQADDRIQIFNRGNIGVFRLNETYNLALSRARGDLVGILEGDDLWTPEKLRLQVEALASHPEAVLSWSRAIIVGNGLDQIRAANPELKDVPEAWRNNDPVGEALNGLYLSNFIPAASILVRTDVLRQAGGFQQRPGLPLVDYPTLLALVTKGPFVFVDEVLAKWRWHPNQVTRLFHTEIITRVRDTALSHHAALEEPIQSRVTVTRNQIERRHRDEVHRAYVQSGRYKLVQKLYREARRDFTNALWHHGLARPFLLLQALAGVGLSFIKTDLEWIARLLGKTDLSWKRVSSEKDAKTTPGVSS